MMPRATATPTDDLAAYLASLNARIRSLETIAHFHDRTYGAFLDTTDQSIGTVNVPQPVTFNTTDLSNGISITSGSRMTIEVPGTYSLIFSLQLHHAGGGGAGEDFYCWLRYNGVAYANSATHTLISSNRYDVMTVNFIGQSQAPGDYVEIMWVTNNANIRIEHIAASGSRPAVPSVIATLARIPG